MCILGHGQCNEQTSCPLHVEWQHLRRELVSMLQNKTIVDVAKSEDTAPKVEVSET
jgi:DNA-binding IscR family transcriptional regulator